MNVLSHEDPVQILPMHVHLFAHEENPCSVVINYDEYAACQQSSIYGCDPSSAKNLERQLLV